MKNYTVTYRKLFLFQFHPQMNVLLVFHPQNPVFVWIHPQKGTSQLKYPQLTKKGFYSPIYEIKLFFKSVPTGSGMATIKLALMIAMLASLSLCVANPSKIEAGGITPEQVPSSATATRRYTLCIYTDAFLCVYTYVCLCATATCARTILAAIFFAWSFTCARARLRQDHTEYLCGLVRSKQGREYTKRWGAAAGTRQHCTHGHGNSAYTERHHAGYYCDYKHARGMEAR